MCIRDRLPTCLPLASPPRRRTGTCWRACGCPTWTQPGRSRPGARLGRLRLGRLRLGRRPRRRSPLGRRSTWRESRAGLPLHLGGSRRGTDARPGPCRGAGGPGTLGVGARPRRRRYAAAAVRLLRRSGAAGALQRLGCPAGVRATVRRPGAAVAARRELRRPARARAGRPEPVAAGLLGGRRPDRGHLPHREPTLPGDGRRPGGPAAGDGEDHRSDRGVVGGPPYRGRTSRCGRGPDPQRRLGGGLRRARLAPAGAAAARRRSGRCGRGGRGAAGAAARAGRLPRHDQRGGQGAVLRLDRRLRRAQHRSGELRDHPAGGDGRRYADRGQQHRRLPSGARRRPGRAAVRSRGRVGTGRRAGPGDRRPGWPRGAGRRRYQGRRAVRLAAHRPPRGGRLRDGDRRRTDAGGRGPDAGAGGGGDAVTVVVAVVALVVAAASYVTWLARRIDRLYARVEAAYAVLDAQLVRRAAAAVQLAMYAGSHGQLDPIVAEAVTAAARAAMDVGVQAREAVENDLSRELRAAFAGPVSTDDASVRQVDELAVAATKVGYARQFHNDAVRDTRALRFSWLPRLLSLSRGRPMPRYFEIDDTALPARSTLAADR